MSEERSVNEQHCVRAVMTSDAVVARTDSPGRDVAELMDALRLRLVPVVDHHRRVVGVVSAGDLRRRGSTNGTSPRWLRRRVSGTAADLMTAPAVTVPVDATLTAAARMLVEHGIRALPVIDEDGLLQGVVARTDVVKSLARTDDDLAAEVGDVLRTYVPSVAATVSWTVHDGVAALSGRPRAQWMIPLTLHLVRSVPGLVAVDDRLRRDTDESPWPTVSASNA